MAAKKKKKAKAARARGAPLVFKLSELEGKSDRELAELETREVVRPDDHARYGGVTPPVVTAVDE